MITVKCQHTGFEFEAESKRSKNHPAVAAFLNTANDDGKRHVGAYAEAKRILTEAAGNFDNIDELMAAASAAYEEWKATARHHSVMTYKDRVRRDNRIAAKLMAERNEDQRRWQIDADYMNL